MTVSSSRIAAAIGALLIAAAVYATTPLEPENGGFGFDGSFYAAMAGHPLAKPELAHVGPWAYRVAAPAAIKRLPWDTLTNFRIAAFVSSAAGAVLMFLILSQLGFADALCALGLVLYAGVFWAMKFAFYTPGYIDAETQLLLLAVIYLSLRGWFVPLIAVLAIGVLVKESLIAFVLFPIAALHRTRGGRLDAAAGAIAAATVAAPLLALVAVHSMVTTVTALDAGAEMREQLPLLISPAYWPVLLQSIFSGLGLVAMVMALRPRSWFTFAREHYEWLVYAVIALALLLGGRDKGRLFLYFLPAAVVFGLKSIQDLNPLARGARGLAWIALLVVTHLFLGGYLTPLGVPAEYLAKLVPEHSNGTYLPYLWRNLAVAIAFTGATWGLMRDTWAKA